VQIVGFDGHTLNPGHLDEANLEVSGYEYLCSAIQTGSRRSVGSDAAGRNRENPYPGLVKIAFVPVLHGTGRPQMNFPKPGRLLATWWPQ
jgi:hypothetical protein